MTTEKPNYRVVIRNRFNIKLNKYALFIIDNNDIIGTTASFEEIYNVMYGDVKWLHRLMKLLDDFLVDGDIWSIEEKTNFGWIDTDLIDSVDMLIHI